MKGGFGIDGIILAGQGASLRPIPARTLAMIARIEVLEASAGQGGFRLVFGAERDAAASDQFAILTGGRLVPFSRVVILVSRGAVPTVLMDGVVTDHWLDPDADEEGEIVVSGADLSVMMDLEEKTDAHPGQGESVIATKIIARYARFGLIPSVKRPSAQETPTPSRRIPIQRASDLDYLDAMAARFGYVFRVSPGPVPLTNIAYWGPAVTRGTQQRALTLASGGLGNVDQLVFGYAGLAARRVKGMIQDPESGKPRTIEVRKPDLPPLARRTPYDAGPMRRRFPPASSGRAAAQAMAMAQGEVNLATTGIVTAEGEVNILAYGDILRAAAPVGVRGAGADYDGLYAVDEVTHVLAPGSYRQRFRLRRDGLGSRQPMLRP